MTVEGLLVVDKPGGMTSHDVVQIARRTLGIRRIGHGGTLDPLATGVLPLLLGRATRLLRFLSHSPKGYIARARLGVETTTGDADGDVIGEPSASVEVDPLALEEALASLRGNILQVPPMFSAKQVAGKRLYEHARAGREIPREAVPVTIHRLEVRRQVGADLELEVDCSPGTYVRTLVTELGRFLGTGASVMELRRVRSGPLTAAQAVPIIGLTPDIASAALVPIDQIPLMLPDIQLGEVSTGDFRAGRATPVEAGDRSGFVAVRATANLLLGIGEITNSATGHSLRPRVVLT